jgi:hypothetical protein
MTPIAPIQSDRSITLSAAGEALSAANAATEPATPSSRPETTTPSSLVSFVPDGGLHPVARKPATALFGFITAKLREVMSKESPTGQTEGQGMKILIDAQRKPPIDPSATTPL